MNTLGVSHVPGLQYKVPFQFIRILKSHPNIHHNIVTTLATLDMVWSCGADVNSWQPTCMHQSTLQMLAAARFTIMPCLWFLERHTCMNTMCLYKLYYVHNIYVPIKGLPGYNMTLCIVSCMTKISLYLNMDIYLASPVCISV